MDAVIKIGGSLIHHHEALINLGKTLTKQPSRHRLLIVPGGAIFAETVRQADTQYHLTPSNAHWMAIYAINQYGYLLSQTIENSAIVESLIAAEEILQEKRLPIFLPANYLLHYDPLPHSWEITSDTISAYIADQIGFSTLVILTDVDGLFTEDPTTTPNPQLIPEITTTQLKQRTLSSCVDPALPEYLKSGSLTCRIINGRHPERLDQILSGQPTKGTTINV